MILHVGGVGLEYEPHYVLSEPEVIGLMRGAYQKGGPLSLRGFTRRCQCAYTTLTGVRPIISVMLNR